MRAEERESAESVGHQIHLCRRLTKTMASQTGHIVRIETHDGSASVGVTLHGACVYSWKVKGVERLFTSTKSVLSFGRLVAAS